MLVVLEGVAIFYVMRYAEKVRANPQASITRPEADWKAVMMSALLIFVNSPNGTIMGIDKVANNDYIFNDRCSAIAMQSFFRKGSPLCWILSSNQRHHNGNR